MSIFLAYHYPCLDGTYSVSMAYLFFRHIQEAGLTAQDFQEYISGFNSFSEIDKSLYEFKGKQLKENQEEETKLQDYSDYSHEYSPKILKEVVYIPARLNANGYFDFPYHQYSPEVLAKSVLFLMDYNAGNAGNLFGLCKMFAKVIVIDHHLTFEHILENLEKYGEYPKNLLYLFNKEKSGATLALEFFEKVKGAPILSDKDKYSRLKEVLSYVEDNDIKAEKVKNSEEFVCGLLKRRMNFDANGNYDIFLDLIEAKPDILIQIGTIEQKNRVLKSREVVKKKHMVYLGGKTKDKKGKFGVCYGVEIEEQELRNEVGSQLAHISFDDKLENMGFVYSYQRNRMVKVSLRSIKDLDGGDCESIARAYKGGGHFNASGFFIHQTEFQNWL